MLNVIYYPVSGVLWFWHAVFGYLMGPGDGVAWALAVVFLVFTLRALMVKPFVSQVRAMRKMNKFAPEIQKLKKKHGDNKQALAAEMQRLQAEHGVNPLGGCLPVLVQIPIFIGMWHVLRSFDRPFLSAERNRVIANYMFSAADVRSFLNARLLGVPLSASIAEPATLLSRYGDISRWQIAAVSVPLALVSANLIHLCAKHSAQHRHPEQLVANRPAVMMDKLVVYVFPLGVVIGDPLLPIAILLYWVSSNVWTLVQQRVVYQRLDAQDTSNILTRTQPQPARPVQHLDSATPPAESAARRIGLRQRPGRHRKATRTRRPPPSPP